MILLVWRKKSNKKLYIIIASIIIILLLAWFFDLFRFLSYIKPEIIKDFIVSFGIYAPIMYFILYSIAIFIPYLAPVMSVTGGLAFGAVKGTILTVIAATITSTFPFLVARKLGREWIHTKLKGTKYEKYSAKVDQNNFLFVMYMRLVPIIPYELQNYIAGLTTIGVPKFMLATLIGIIPGSFALTFLGESITDVTSPKFYLAIGIFVVAIIAPIVVSSLMKKKKEK